MFWSNCWDIIRSHIANWDFLPAEARSPCVQINKTESFYICVERSILLIVEHKSYVAHIYVAVTQLTQMEYQQHFIYYKYFYQTDLVCQKICINQESWLLNWTAHKCTCQATRRLRRSSRSCKLFLPSQPQPSLLSGSFIIGVYVIDNILVSLPPSFFIMHLVPLVVE